MNVTVFPEAEALIKLIPEDPPRFRILVVPWVNVPVPESAAVALMVPLLVRTPGVVTVSVASVNVPLLV